MFYPGAIMTIWAQELDKICELMRRDVSLEEIGEQYDVSKQRIYQVLTKYGIETPNKKRSNFLRDRGPEIYWLDRMLRNKGFSREDRLKLLDTMQVPEHCPMLGLKLNYDGTDFSGWTRQDNSPSIDRIDSSKDYTADNIQIISWRANRIKNDATPEELRKIADYLTKNNLQL